MKKAYMSKVPNLYGEGYFYEVRILENGHSFAWYTGIKTLEEANKIIERTSDCILEGKLKEAM